MNGRKIHLVKNRLISSINITKNMTNKYHQKKPNRGLSINLNIGCYIYYQNTNINKDNNYLEVLHLRKKELINLKIPRIYQQRMRIIRKLKGLRFQCKRAELQKKTFTKHSKKWEYQCLKYL